MTPDETVSVDLPSCVGLWPEPWFQRHRRCARALEHLGVDGDKAHLAAQALAMSRAASGEPHLSEFGLVELVSACLEALGNLKRRSA